MSTHPGEKIERWRLSIEALTKAGKLAPAARLKTLLARAEAALKRQRFEQRARAGGLARAASLSPARRQEIARAAAEAGWARR